MTCTGMMEILVVTIALIWTLNPVSGIAVRLVHGSDQYEGNVEIFDDGIWGYICDDSWDSLDARVICRMLGYNTSYVWAYDKTYFRNGIWLQNVSCSGSEKSIDQCSNNGWAAHNCTPKLGAKVRCGLPTTTPSPSPSDIGVRLIGGLTQYEGIVEVLYNGTWRTLCNNESNWKNTEAEVVCRTLGFGSDNVSANCCDQENFLMTNVFCTGEEDLINLCPFSTYDNCDHTELAGVTCGCSRAMCYNCPAGQYQNQADQSVCIPCPEGQYQNQTGQTTCLPCSKGHFQKYTGQTVCTPCPMGQYQNSDGEKYCRMCPVGQYQNLTGQASCVLCPIGHYQNRTGKAYCLSCPEGQYQNLTGQLTCLSCPIGWYRNQTGKSSCLPCPTGQYQSLEGQSFCLPCPGGQYQYLMGQTYCFRCPFGQFQNLTAQLSCESCPVGQYQNLTGQMSCISCPTGWYQSLTSQASCVMCPFGYYQNMSGQSSCYSCPIGQYQNVTGQVSCIPCPIGLYNDKNGQANCIHCPAGTYQNKTGQSRCYECPASTYQNSTGQPSCDSCTSGSYQNLTGQTDCQICPVGTYQVLGGQLLCEVCRIGTFQNLTGQDDCEVCPSGSYQNVIGQRACNVCSIGTYQNKSGQAFCEHCSSGTYQNMTGQSSCHDCELGTYQNMTGQSSCHDCELGTYQNMTGQSSCHDCELGTYQNMTGQSSCHDCELGTYQNMTGQSSCHDCELGTYQNMTGQSSCHDCELGTYQNMTGQSSCHDCELGTYQNMTGQSSCHDCEHGTYQNMTGQSSCHDCELGTYQNNTGQSSCHDCELGTYQNNTGQSSCHDCELGTYQNMTGQSSCHDCELGTYQNNTGQSSCHDCELGTYQNNTGQSSCHDCELGTYQNMTGQSSCHDCELGTYQNMTGQSSCHDCELGTYQNMTGQSSCHDCELGTYQNNTGQSSCHDCELGTYQNMTGQSSCHDCELGTYQNMTGQSSCHDCEHGTYQNMTGQSSCHDCELGTYQNMTGQSSCHDCELGTYQNNTGQSSCHDCELGTYQNNTGQSSCHDCELGTYQNMTGQSSCHDCELGTYQNMTGQSSCHDCELGTYQNMTGQSSCHDCELGTYQNMTGQSSCHDCELGTYQNMTGQSSCHDCEHGTYQNMTGQSSCHDCEHGTYQNMTGQSSCHDCEFGTYQNMTGQSSCHDCELGTYQNMTGQSSCHDCEHGTYQNMTGQSSCHDCELGTYQNMTGQSSCHDCELGTYQNNTGQSSCHDCELGTYQNMTGQSSCHDCELGTYQNMTGQSSCHDCELGTYQNMTGKSSCNICPVGHYQNLTRQTLCKVCPRGTYQNMVGQSFCNACLTGTFQNKTGEFFCDNCSVGNYQEQTGQVKCEACTAGTYQNLTGQSACTPCQPGTFQNFSSQISCQLCPVGSFSNQTGTTLCMPCEVGTYQNSSGQTSCLPCGENKTTNSEGSGSGAECYTEVVCNPGYFEDFHSHVCLQCPVGTYQSQLGSRRCFDCSEGKITLQAGSPSDQYCLHPCPAGYYHTSNISTNSTCEPCPKGQYQPKTGQSKCLICQEGSTSYVNGSTRCSNKQFLFGLEHEDTLLSINEDACSERIDIVPIVIFGRTYEDVHICANGIISLNSKYMNPNPPLTQISGFSFLAAYYTDIDLGVFGTAGSIYYQVYDVIKNRSISMHENVIMAEKIIRDAENRPFFAVKILLIVTWHTVRPFPAVERNREQMSFQALIATDGVDTYFLSAYFNGEMNLIKGTVFIGYNIISGQYSKHLASNTSAAFTPDVYIASNGIQGLLFYRLSSPESKENNDEITCLEIFENGQSVISIYVEKEKQMPECPCNLELLQLDNWFTKPFKTDANTVCSRIHPAYWFSPHGKTCCYDKETGTYLTFPPRAGGFLMKHPATWRKQNEAEDVYMRDVCCEKSQHCDLYYLLHPTGTCYSKLPFLFGFSWGDPHIETLYGLKYTFNGWGEYTMVELNTGNISFTLQARTERATTADGGHTNATLFSAFAARDNQNASVHIELNKNKNGLNIYGNKIDYTSSFYEERQFILETATLSITKELDNATITVLFPSSGVSLNVSLGIGMLSLGISIPRQYSNNTRGLLGIIDANQTNDNAYTNETTQSINATEREIFQYGETWRIKADQSTFIYPPGKSFKDFYNSDFVPKYSDEMNKSVVKEAEIVCRENLGNSDIRTCVFDFVLTNNTEVAIQTGNVDKISTDTIDKAGNAAPIVLGDNVLNVTLNETFTTYAYYSDDTNAAKIGFFINNINAHLTIIDNNSAKITFKATSDDPNIYRLKVVDEQGSMTTQEICIQFCTGCSGHGYCDFTTRRNDNRTTPYFKYAKCICDSPWQGENCEEDFDGCLSKPCSHGRNCTDVEAAEQVISNRSYVCSKCPDGYYATGDKCIDINECVGKTFACDQICINTDGSYICLCHNGYRLHVDGLTCRDINECAEIKDNCQHECINTNGSYKCSCYRGYTLDPSSNQCIPGSILEECSKRNCSKATGCSLDTNGNAICFCEKGYRLNDNQECKDIDECKLGICSQTCNNIQGGYRCNCLSGYQLDEDKVTCRECPYQRYGDNCSLTCQCERGAVACNHIKGCVCGHGWTGENCNIDIDECSDSNLYNCGEKFENKECHNNIGSYECRCKEGFQEPLFGSCTDIDECSRPNLNLCEQRCENVWGNYSCSCQMGFVRDTSNMYSCKDIDECVEGISGCEQICENVPGRFNCYCHYGYILDQDRKHCIKEFDQCSGFSEFNCSHICLVKDKKQECYCRLGYSLADDKEKCLDIDECVHTTLNRCNPPDICENMPGGYTCKCPPGQKLENNGRTCTACDAYHYGENCANVCACSPIAERCDSITGCVCPANWTGSRCDTQIQCAGGRNNCTGQSNECVNSSGIRFCTCKAGYMKTNRSSEDCFECVNNTFGRDCSESCKCFEDKVISIYKMCDPVSGLCICKQGWTGNCAEDVDECQENTYNCTDFATSVCYNVPGGFECTKVVPPETAPLILILAISIPVGLLLFTSLILIICLVRRKSGIFKISKKHQRPSTTSSEETQKCDLKEFQQREL